MTKRAEPYSVLISSVSKKVPLIKAVRRAVQKFSGKGSLFGGDADPGCIGRYFVDTFWQMPLLKEMAIEDFITYCLTKKISCVIPTRDRELPFFAKNKALLESKGIFPMVSGPEAVRTCLDKHVFYQTLERKGYPVIQSANDLSGIKARRFVVKERFGAGSANIGLNLTKSQAKSYLAQLKRPLVQPFIKGSEVSCDLYRDKMGRVLGVVARKRELVVGGESQITRTFRSREIESLCEAMAHDVNLYGHAIFQLICEEGTGRLHVLECNPRFGGASTLSLHAGLDSFYWFFLEQAGKTLSGRLFRRPKKEKLLVRYPEDKIL